jgi:hypothetical protein
MDFLFNRTGNFKMISQKNKYILNFKKLLQKKGIDVIINGNSFICSANKKKYSFMVSQSEKEEIPFDYLVTRSEKLVALIQSKLGLNKTVFARNCEVKKIDKETATDFLDKYHIINSTQSAFNYGLTYKNELLAMASFSKGRKMNRLPINKRSFELIRFCCKEGITITGGLTKLIKNFCKDKEAGDIMTYIDKQFSEGASFIRAGFVKHSETEANYFLINRKTFERLPLKSTNEAFDESLFYKIQNSGNLKLVYTPIE